MKKITTYGMSFIVALASACTTPVHVQTLAEKPTSSDIAYADKMAKWAATEVSDSTFYHKYYKFTTNTEQIRFIERFYYGPKQDIIKDVNAIETDKELNRLDYTKYPTASFFNASSISIPEATKEQAVNAYTPLLDTIINSATNELHAEILVLGYCDDTPLEFDTPFYEELMLRSQKEYLFPTTYRNYVSYFRAKEVANMISEIMHKRKHEFTKFNKVIIDLYVEGRALEFPEARRTYQDIDAKRRISKVYWRIK